MADDRIIITPGTDITAVPDGTGQYLVVGVTPNTFARLVQLLSDDGSSWVGHDPEADAYDEATVGDALATLFGKAKGLVSLPGHITFTPANDGADMELKLPQAMGLTDTVAFGAVKAGRMGGLSSTLSVVSLGDGAGPGTPVYGLLGTTMATQFTLTVGGAPSGGGLTVATFAFPQAYTYIPRVIMIPGNRRSWLAQTAIATACEVPEAYVSTTGFVFNSGVTTALVADQIYSWFFLVLGE